ncbi:hypothetical protein [Streptomyces phaeochromogenes]
MRYGSCQPAVPAGQAASLRQQFKAAAIPAKAQEVAGIAAALIRYRRLGG